MSPLAALHSAVALLALSWPAFATEYFVRSDGGDAQQCNGRSDRARAAAGNECAWAHPFFALPPGAAPRIAGGDTLRVAPGSYRIGLGAPGAEACSAAFPWDCTMAPVPAGSARAPTRILGTDAKGRCVAKPELWGTERASQVLDLSGSAHVEVACLEITDHAACVENHCHGGACGGEVARCERDAFPYGDWSGTGVRAKNANNIVLRDLDIHGMALRGVHAAGLSDWHVERVRIAGNGWSGWDGDMGEGSSNRGTMHFQAVEIAWNGCAERWPSGEPFACWGQGSGGYGDGLGTAATAGAWRFRDVNVHHNASDGLDLLYLTAGGSVEVLDSRFAGNAGNQLKAAGQASVQRSRIDGSCAALGAHGVLSGDLCRAGGNALVVALGSGAVDIGGNTLAGEGDCLLVVEGGDAATRVRVRDNRFTGRPMWNDSERRSCGFYSHAGSPQLDLGGNEFSGVRGR